MPQSTRVTIEPHCDGDIVGIDMGIARFATLSDVSDLAPLNRFKRHEAAVRNAQRAMSRKSKFSITMGRRRKPASSIYTPVLATPAATNRTKPRPPSAKTTRLRVLRM